MIIRILIYDLLLANAVFHTTPRPTKAGMLISGWHKSQGDSVVLTDVVPDFGRYDKVYIIKDAEELAHEPQWLKNDNLVLVGKGWPSPTWETKWETAMPDQFLYRGWADAWRARYPSVSEARMASFYRRPVLLRQDGKIVIPAKDNNIIIIDDDLHIWDKDGDNLCKVPTRNGLLLYPIELDGRWEAALKIFEQRHLLRRNLWFDFKSTISEEELQEACELLNLCKPGRMMRIRMHSWANSDAEWAKEIPNMYEKLARFRNETGRRVWCVPHNINSYTHTRILKEFKRWTAMNQGYNNNSLFTYIIYDSCRNMVAMAEFFKDPYDYVARKRQGTNKFSQMLAFIEEEPELMDVITTSYQRSGY